MFGAKERDALRQEIDTLRQQAAKMSEDIGQVRRDYESWLNLLKDQLNDYKIEFNRIGEAHKKHETKLVNFIGRYKRKELQAARRPSG